MAEMSLQRVGPTYGGSGTGAPFRGDVTGAGVVTDAHGHYNEAAIRSALYSMVLPATTTGVAAGNIIAAAAAAVTQFALFNPLNSGRYLSLIKFGMGVISGTPGAGPLFHGLFNGVPTLAPSGTILNHNGVAGGSIARGYASAAGAALTGGPAPTTLRIADFAATGTAQAVANGHVKAIEMVDGDIIVPPGFGWAPLWGGAGTSLLNGYSVTWEEVPFLA